MTDFCLILLMLPAAWLAVLLVRWVRKGHSGALVLGALLSLFAPDPMLEQKVKTVREAGRRQREEDREDDDSEQS